VLSLLLLAGCATQNPDSQELATQGRSASATAAGEPAGEAAADELIAGVEVTDSDGEDRLSLNVDRRLTVQSAEDEPADIPPGTYDIYFSSATQFVLAAPDGELSILVDAVAAESGELDSPNTAYLQEKDGEVWIRATREDGSTVAAAAQVSQVQARGIYVVPKPDLTISIRTPNPLFYDDEKNLTVTIRNIGYRDATGINFFIYTIDEDNNNIDSLDLISPTSGTLRCTKQAFNRISCYYAGTVLRGSLRNLNVRVRFKERDSGQLPWSWKFDLHVDCSTSAYHGSGGSIREMNERNNTAGAQVYVRRPADLSRAGVTAFDYRVGSRNYQAVRKNVLNPVRVKVKHFPDSTISGWYEQPTTGIKVVATFSMFTIISVDGSRGGFNCNFSNTTKKVTCTGGRLPYRNGSQNIATGIITVNVVPLASAPIGTTPVVVSIDPDGRIRESNEANNSGIYNLYIRN
jgi:hypothetical protein